MCAANVTEVRELGLYRYELRPAALMHFRKRSTISLQRNIAHAKLTSIRTTTMLTFISLSPMRWRRQMGRRRGPFRERRCNSSHMGIGSLQGYAHVFLRKNRELPRAEQLLRQAERLNPFHSYTLVDLGRLLARFNKDQDAEVYFRRAVDSDGDNTRACYEYAKFLKEVGRVDEALEMAVAALESNPTNPQNKVLVRELRQRVEDAGLQR